MGVELCHYHNILETLDYQHFFVSLFFPSTTYRPCNDDIGK